MKITFLRVNAEFLHTKKGIKRKTTNTLARKIVLVNRGKERERDC